MPTDSTKLRDELHACLPSFVIDSVAKESGQRVVYFGHFDDLLIPSDLSESSTFLKNWSSWGNIVAKVVSGIDATSLTYLQREVALLKEIDSPHFPRLHFSDVFTHNPITDSPLSDRLYITIEERIPSLPLSATRNQYTTESEIAKLLLELCSALSLLWGHKKRLVHRDLKPDNILVRADGSIVIIDLGIVRETGSAGNTLTAHPWGPMSPAYAAPEQVTNDKYSISYKTDFFALGIIAYELAANINPFMPDVRIPAADVMHAVLNHNPPNLATLGKVSEEFSSIIERLMKKQPYQRYRTPDLLVNALKALGANK